MASAAFFGMGGVAFSTLPFPTSARTRARSAQTPPTIRAEAQAGSTMASARMAAAVNAPRAHSARMPAAANIPAPTPACFTFSEITRFATSMSRTSVRTPNPMIAAFRSNEPDREPFVVAMVRSSPQALDPGALGPPYPGAHGANRAPGRMVTRSALGGHVSRAVGRGERAPGVGAELGEEVPQPFVCGIRAHAPGSLGRPGHDVQVVHRVARWGHAWPVIAPRDQEHVAVAHRYGDVDVAIRSVRAVQPEPAVPPDPEVVDLLQRHLALGELVVLVRWERRPVPVRCEHLDRDEPLRLERVGRHEVVDLPRGRAASSDLHGHGSGRHVGGFQSPLGASRRKRELATAVAGEDDLASLRKVDEIADAGEDVDAPVQLESVRSDLDTARARERKDRGLESLERDRKSTRLNSSHVKISYAVFC